MKTKIKVREVVKGCMPKIFEVGDWIDLKTSKDIELKKWESTLIPLGVCIKVPEGYESILVPRSSTFKKWNVIQTNSIGVIDQMYCGYNDEWKMPVVAFKSTFIPKGTRIAQFRVQLSQKATVIQKIKNIFNGTIEVVQVESLNTDSRGGFGEGTKDK